MHTLINVASAFYYVHAPKLGGRGVQFGKMLTASHKPTEQALPTDSSTWI